ncbi:MAG: RNA polymerase sigma factor [Chromatiales bacterium]|nr:RNA polymerase sigma factor [Chromatiales bacterium]
MEQLGIVIKASRSHALATLIRLLGDFDLAEEAIQEAVYRAVIDWQSKKVIPENPVAWLVQTGRRYATDVVRHREMAQRHHQTLAPLQTESVEQDQDEEMSSMHLPDDQLRLIFTCCHPALAQEAQVALTLKTVAGLSIDEIARTYLTSAKTIDQRLTRAKRKIRDAAIPYQVPSEEQLEVRLEAVMSVLYLIYNQAYTTLKGSELLDKQLSETAIYLTRMLSRLMRGNPEVQGLLALMLLQHARAAARSDDQGAPVPLEQQDRTRWDQKLIAEGTVLVEKSLRHQTPGRYTLQAAIAAVHCQAKQPEETDWEQISMLYDLLEGLTPGPVVTLNRAIAVARWKGADVGLQILDTLQHEKSMAGFQYYHSARAGLLEEMGDYCAALAAYREALRLCRNSAEIGHLQSRIEQIEEHCGPRRH